MGGPGPLAIEVRILEKSARRDFSCLPSYMNIELKKRKGTIKLHFQPSI